MIRVPRNVAQLSLIKAQVTRQFEGTIRLD